MAAQRALLPLYRFRFNLLYQFGFLDIASDEWVAYEQQNTKGHPDVNQDELLAKLPAFSTPDEVVLLDIEIPEESPFLSQQSSSPVLDFPYPNLSSTAAAALNTLARALSLGPVSVASKVRLMMPQVRRLYPLTTQAGQFLASRLDTRIHRQQAVFESVAERVDARQFAEETRLGCKALFVITGLPVVSPDNALLTDIGRAVDVLLGRRQHQGSDSFWVYLVAYNRYEPFPKDDYGYLYDLCVVFSRSLSAGDGNRAQPNDYERTGFFKALESNRTRVTGTKVTTLLLQADWAASLRQQLTDSRTGLQKYLVAFLFLKLRREFETDDYAFGSRLMELVRQTAKVYPKETNVALQLLGGFLTFHKLAPAYYGTLQLPLFQERGQRFTRVVDVKPEPRREPELFTIQSVAPVIVAPSEKAEPDEQAPVYEWTLSTEQDARKREQALQQIKAPVDEPTSVGAEEPHEEITIAHPELITPEPPAIKQKRQYRKASDNSAAPLAEKPVKVKQPSKSKVRKGLLDSISGQLIPYPEEQPTETTKPDSAPEM